MAPSLKIKNRLHSERFSTTIQCQVICVDVLIRNDKEQQTFGASKFGILVRGKEIVAVAHVSMQLARLSAKIWLGSPTFFAENSQSH